MFDEVFFALLGDSYDGGGAADVGAGEVSEVGAFGRGAVTGYG